jgi:hypothetical protein
MLNFGYWGDNIFIFSILLVLLLIIVIEIFGLKKVPLAYNSTTSLFSFYHGFVFTLKDK